MRYYIIMHLATGKIMPEFKSGKGYSFWLYDDNVDNQKKVPRLFETHAQAKKSIIEWSKGVFEWVNFGAWDEPFADQRRRIKDVGRNKMMLAVVEVELTGVEHDL